MKKLISIMLSGVLVISTITPCFANAIVNNEASIVDNMVRSGISTLLSETEDRSGTKVYTIETAGIQATVAKEAVDEGVLYTFQEGNLKNELLLTSDDDMYLDGDLVTVSTSYEGAELTGITPRAYYESWDFSTSAFAKGSYTSNETTIKTTVALQKKIAQVTLSVLAGIVATALFGNLEAGAAAYTFTSKGLDKIYEWLHAYNPEASSLYVKKTISSNGKPALNGNPLKYYYKVKTEYYKDSAYKDYYSGGTFYALQKIVNH